MVVYDCNPRLKPEDDKFTMDYIVRDPVSKEIKN
jgi:hypothetical protein